MASSQKVSKPGKSAKFPRFDNRTSTPTKAGKGNIQHGKGLTGRTGGMKRGGNAAGGQGGKAC